MHSIVWDWMLANQHQKGSERDGLANVHLLGPCCDVCAALVLGYQCFPCFRDGRGGFSYFRRE